MLTSMTNCAGWQFPSCDLGEGSINCVVKPQYSLKVNKLVLYYEKNKSLSTGNRDYIHYLSVGVETQGNLLGEEPCASQFPLGWNWHHLILAGTML